MTTAQTLLVSAAIALAAIGLVTLALSLFWDRARGRTRCPHCWYDLSGTPRSGGDPVPCPECGRTPRSPRATRRTRRYYKPAAAGLLLIACGVFFAGREASRGVNWWAKLPVEVLIRAIPYSDRLPQEYRRELDRRIWPPLNRVNQQEWFPVVIHFESLSPRQKELLGRVALHTIQNNASSSLDPILLSCLRLCTNADAGAAQAILISRLADPSGDTRAIAAAALGELPDDRATTVRAIIAALQIPGTPVMTGGGKPHVGRGLGVARYVAVGGFASDAEASWRTEAIHTLGRCGTFASDSVPILLKHIDNAFVNPPASNGMGPIRSCTDMVQAVWIALGEMGPRAAAALPVLERADAGPSGGDFIEPRIAELLINGSASSRDDALRILTSPTNWRTRRAAATAIGAFEPLQDAWATILESMLSDEDSYVRNTAAESLLKHGARREACEKSLAFTPVQPKGPDAWDRVWIMWRYDLDPTPLIPALESQRDVTTSDAVRDNTARMIGEIRAGRRHPNGNF